MPTTWRIPTAAASLQRLQAGEIQISLSGRKRCYDNILPERLWRTLKNGSSDLQAYSNGLKRKSAWPEAWGDVAIEGRTARE